MTLEQKIAVAGLRDAQLRDATGAERDELLEMLGRQEVVVACLDESFLGLPPEKRLAFWDALALESDYDWRILCRLIGLEESGQ